MDTQVQSGDVEIRIDGRTMALRPSLNAIIGLSNYKGGLSMVVGAIQALDFETMTIVIALGLGRESGTEDKELSNKVYQTGIINLVAPCTRYVNILANGGKPLDEPKKATGN